MAIISVTSLQPPIYTIIHVVDVVRSDTRPAAVASATPTAAAGVRIVFRTDLIRSTNCPHTATASELPGWYTPPAAQRVMTPEARAVVPAWRWADLRRNQRRLPLFPLLATAHPSFQWVRFLLNGGVGAEPKCCPPKNVGGVSPRPPYNRRSWLPVRLRHVYLIIITISELYMWETMHRHSTNAVQFIQMKNMSQKF